MTNTEAVAVLKKEALFFKEINRHEGDEDLIAEALDMAISALELQEKAKEAWDSMMEITQIATDVLEQKPCEDVVSRDAVCNIVNDIRDCISVEGYWAILERLKKLPSVTQKSGKWKREEFPNFTVAWFCNKCGIGSYRKSNYCPNCGACMKDGRTLDEFIEDSKKSE